MKHQISMTVNGAQVQGSVDSRLLLVHFLRENLRLTGTHVGCDTTQCGACTVLMDGRAVKSCTVLGVEADGAQIRTVEGLANGDELHPIQQAFSEKHGLQCGYCTPGMMMATVDLLQRFPSPSRERIKEELDGNICRCTGYRQIVDAIEYASQLLDGERKPSESGE